MSAAEERTRMPIVTRMGNDSIDLEVEANIRRLRRAQKISQADLAKPLGITYQQVQK